MVVVNGIGIRIPTAHKPARVEGYENAGEISSRESGKSRRRDNPGETGNYEKDENGMKFETVEAWPDKSAEYRALADAVNAAHADNGKSVRVDLDERKTPTDEAVTLAPLSDVDLDKLRISLSNQVRKHGRFDVKREGRYAYVRVSTAAPRTKKATKKAAPAKGK